MDDDAGRPHGVSGDDPTMLGGVALWLVSIGAVSISLPGRALQIDLSASNGTRQTPAVRIAR